MQDVITKIISDARDRFAEWLGRYKAWHGNNGITERNLSFQFASAFLSAQEGGLAFMEVPFPSKEGGQLRNHLDAYCHCDNFDVLLECKVVWSETLAKSVAADIERLRHPLLHNQISQNHIKSVPKRTYGLVLAETWEPKVVKWWEQSVDDDLRWSRDDFPSDWRYEVISVAKVSDERDGTLYWLYGISPDLRMEQMRGRSFNMEK